jgi:hypothetical protein
MEQSSEEQLQQPKAPKIRFRLHRAAPLSAQRMGEQGGAQPAPGSALQDIVQVNVSQAASAGQLSKTGAGKHQLGDGQDNKENWAATVQFQEAEGDLRHKKPRRFEGEPQDAKGRGAAKPAAPQQPNKTAAKTVGRAPEQQPAAALHSTLCGGEGSAPAGVILGTAARSNGAQEAAQPLGNAPISWAGATRLPTGTTRLPAGTTRLPAGTTRLLGGLTRLPARAPARQAPKGSGATALPPTSGSLPACPACTWASAAFVSADPSRVSRAHVSGCQGCWCRGGSRGYLAGRRPAAGGRARERRQAVPGGGNSAGPQAAASHCRRGGPGRSAAAGAPARHLPPEPGGTAGTGAARGVLCCCP